MVELVPIVDADQVLPAIARTLGVKETTGRSPLDAVLDHVQGRRMLLLLDNFEHVLAGAAVVSDLLRASPTLSVLVTSRAPLEIGGEHELPVPPLGLPDFGRELTPVDVAHAPAVSLFVERAAAIRPDFKVIPDNAHAIAEICRRLDALPLAIELAAARIRLLSPEAMLSRLDNGLGLLAGGRRDVPARHRTLQSAIAWSYALLPEAEQRLFRRLSVFVGGFTLEAAGAICGRDGPEPAADPPALDPLDGVGTLVANSLVLRDERGSSEPRFRMLETIREYGLEQLASSGEEPAVRTRHLTWCVALAEEGIQAQNGPTWGAWLDRFEAEHDNLRAGLAWGQHDPYDPVLGLRLARALAGFWLLRGYHNEGRAWLARSLAQVPARTALRAAALANAGFLAVRQNDYRGAAPYLEEALSISREISDTRGLAQTLLRYGVVPHHLGDFEKAGAMLRESLALAPPSEMADYQRTAADARAALGEERFAEIWAAGNAMSLEEAVSLAMDESKAAELAHAGTVRDPTRRVPVEPTAWAAEPKSQLIVRGDGSVSVPLSAREREVVALIAGGLTNRAIAERLVLSVRTVERHIENVYNRLGISGKAGRAIVTAYALRHGIAAPARSPVG